MMPVIDWQNPVWWSHTALWSGLTIVLYRLAIRLSHWCRGHPLAIPILTATIMLVAILLLTHTDHTDYEQGTSVLLFLMAPALVVLAVPMRQQMQRLRQIWWPLTVALLAGSVTAIVSAVLIAWALGADKAMLVSFIPKSATSPIAISVVAPLGGIPAITALLVCATGIAGAILARPLLGLLKWNDDTVRGVAVGTAAHAVGTAREMQDSPVAGVYAALAMSLNGLLTAVLTPLVAWLLHLLVG